MSACPWSLPYKAILGEWKGNVALPLLRGDLSSDTCPRGISNTIVYSLFSKIVDFRASSTSQGMLKGKKKGTAKGVCSAMSTTDW